MFKKNKISVFLMTALFCNLSLAADLLDVYKRALENDNQIKIIDADYFIAQEQYNQTLSTVFPEINLTAQSKENHIDRYEGGGNLRDYRTDSYSLNITQPILRLGLFDELDKASENLNKYNVNQRSSQKDLIVNSTRLYFSLINLKNRIVSSEIKKSMSELQLSNARLLFQNGLITNIELNKYKSNYRLAKIELQELENEFVSVKQDVYLLTGKEIIEISNFDIKIDLRIKEYDIETILSRAMSEYETIKMALHDVSIAKNDLSSNKSGYFPTVDIVASYDYTDTSSGSYRGASTQEISEISLVFNLPIFEGGYTNSKVRESRHNLEKMKFTLDLVRKKLKKDIVNTYNGYVLNKELIEVRRNNFEEEKENYLTIKNGFLLGVNSDIQVTEANYNLHTAKNEYIQSMMNLILSDLEIKKYSQDLTIQDIESINQWLVW